MTRTLYGAPLSPFVRKVRLCLLHKGLDYQLENVLPFTPPTWYYELNPLGRIPALKDGDLTLADSSVICQYLDEQYRAAPGLYGQDAAHRARVRWLEKYADYELAPLATFTVFANRILKPIAGKSSDEAVVHGALDKLAPHFDYLERQLGMEDYFVANQLSMADLAIATQLVNMEHGGERLEASRWPRLAAHYARMKTLASLSGLLAEEQGILAKLKEPRRTANV